MNVNRSHIQQPFPGILQNFDRAGSAGGFPRKGSSPAWAETPARRLGERQRVERGPRPRADSPSGHPIKRAKLQVRGGKRALRRAHDRRMKDRARRVMKRWFGRHLWPPDPRKVGVNASTHCRPCGSSMLRRRGTAEGPRSFYKIYTV
jgi:hypothetical protein